MHQIDRAWRVTIDRFGEMNCDGRIDLNDIDPFVQALLDPTSYQAAYPLCPISHADMNQDGVSDGLDVSGFVADLLGV